MAAPDEPELNDEDFVPRDDPHPVEELRRYIRQRLAGGATQREVEDELTRQGLDPVYASDIVSSVRTTGRYGELEVGTEYFVNGVPAGFFQNPVFQRKQRLARRVARRDREAVQGTDAPTPELVFTAPDSARQAARRLRWRLRRRLVLIFLALCLVTAAALIYGFQR